MIPRSSRKPANAKNTVRAWTMEPATHIFAEKLAWPFHEAGWEMVFHASNYAGNICSPDEKWDCRGLGVIVRDRNSELAKVVISALSTLHGRMGIRENPKIEPDVVEVFVTKDP